jgi:AbrB family looped-hinge helix DNA binding protein
MPKTPKTINLNYSGIVRRIDDLGRVIIPKDVRNRMGINEGDPFEIMFDADAGVIILMKCETESGCDVAKKG